MVLFCFFILNDVCILNLNSFYLTYSVLLASEVEFRDLSVAYNIHCSFHKVPSLMPITQLARIVFWV